jgi:hypothetical protein
LTKARLLVVSCLLLAACGTSAWGADVDDSPAALFLPPSISPMWNTDSALNFSVEDFRSASSLKFFSPAFDETDTALRGLQARYQMGLKDESLELSGGYMPGVKGVIPSESQLDPDAYLGYVNLKIPLHRFYLSGGAFFGQNMDALTLIGQSPLHERGPQRSLFGYQVGGGYKFSDTLSIQAGWGQAAQERDISRDDLRAWYVQAQISLGWRISITPQVGYVDFMNGDGEKTKEEAFYCGARWQINF